MPIKIPNALPAAQVLTDENIFIMTETRAITQDIRPLKILLLNLMPKKIETETQLARLLSNTPLQVELEDCLAEEQGDDVKREVGIITGVLPADYMRKLLTKIQSKFTGLSFEIYPIINHFFGERITVSGLVTGTDIIAQLKGKKIPSRVLIPSSMLRAEQDMFLDSITLEEVSKEIARPISVSMNDGADLLDKILGR